MKNALYITALICTSLLMSCDGKEAKKKAGFSYEQKMPSTEQNAEKSERIPPSKQVDLTNKGIGPITSLNIPSKIDKTMVSHGADVFKKLCAACHRTDKKFIGPSPKKILERRTPEWVMNMILNPNEMVQKDPLAKALLIEFNGSPMMNQNITTEDARALLEYFRTLQ